MGRCNGRAVGVAVRVSRSEILAGIMGVHYGPVKRSDILSWYSRSLQNDVLNALDWLVEANQICSSVSNRGFHVYSLKTLWWERKDA